MAVRTRAVTAVAMTGDDLATMAAHINELTTHHPTVVRYHIWSKSRHPVERHHTAWHPPLLLQLRQAAHTQAPAADGTRPGRHGKPSPKAPANLDAVDRLHAIETGTAQWLTLFDLPSRGRLEDDLRQLVGAAATTDPATREQIAKAIDQWRLWCQTLAGWRTPPWRPNAPCPRCERMPGDKAGLRVRLDRSTACCVSCGAVWGPDTVGLLAEHVRQFKGGKE